MPRVGPRGLSLGGQKYLPRPLLGAVGQAQGRELRAPVTR